MSDQSQKVRLPNFTSSEKAHLIRIIANKYANTLEDKKTDRASSAHKDRAWQAIENEFNASSTCTTYRTATCLRKCYENRKKELRKSLAEEKKEIMLTGGGPPPKVNKENDDLLISILNKKTLVGLTNRFDDDAENSTIGVCQQDDNVVFDYVDYGVESDKERSKDSFSQAMESTSGFIDSFTNPTKHSDVLEKITQAECNNLRISNNRSWKKYTPDQLQAPVSAALDVPDYESGKNVSSRDHKTPQRSLSRRRPATVIKPLASSDIAKKYDLLLDKRLQLIDSQLKHNERENELVIEKHKLEIRILESELAKKREHPTS